MKPIEDAPDAQLHEVQRINRGSSCSSGEGRGGEVSIRGDAQAAVQKSGRTSFGRPLEIGKTWNETNLFVWWTAARAADSYLTWERAPGDHVWQHVKVMCGELIGRDAAF